MIIRSVTPADYPLLTDWGNRFFGEDNFRLPFGFAGESVGTAVAERDGRAIAALTASRSFYVGPLVHSSDREFVTALRALDQEIITAAPIFGVADAYLAAPAGMVGWHRVLEKKFGYQPMPEELRWFWKPLRIE